MFLCQNILQIHSAPICLMELVRSIENISQKYRLRQCGHIHIQKCFSKNIQFRAFFSFYGAIIGLIYKKNQIWGAIFRMFILAVLHRIISSFSDTSTSRSICRVYFTWYFQTFWKFIEQIWGQMRRNWQNTPYIELP